MSRIITVITQSSTEIRPMGRAHLVASHPSDSAVVISPKVNSGIPLLNNLWMHVTLTIHELDDIKLLTNSKSILEVVLVLVRFHVHKVNSPHASYLVIELTVDINNNAHLLGSPKHRVSPTW